MGEDRVKDKGLKDKGLDFGSLFAGIIYQLQYLSLGHDNWQFFILILTCQGTCIFKLISSSSLLPVESPIAPCLPHQIKIACTSLSSYLT